MSNKIVTSVSALTDDGIETYSDTGVVCIDTNQGFIGVHKSNPAFHIDVSGTIRCAELKIGSTTVNLSGQIDLIRTASNILPLVTDTYDLGSTSRFWSNAYIQDISASNISVSGDLEPFTTINTSKLGTTSKFWSNAYIQDISASNISVSGDLEPLIPNTSKLGSATKLWSNAYITNINAAVITISNSAIFTGSVSGITKTMVGLSNVNNTTDADKQVSTATRTELNLKANISGGTFTGPVIFNNLASTTFNSSATFTSTSSMNDISANNITTTTNNFGFIGTTLRRWGDGYINNLYSYIIRPTDYVLSSIGTFDAFWPLVYIKDIVLI
jgi:hypothetical protein